MRPLLQLLGDSSTFHTKKIFIFTALPIPVISQLTSPVFGGWLWLRLADYSHFMPQNMEEPSMCTYYACPIGTWKCCSTAFRSVLA